jgi:crossover junction endodeoxyribonuclease RuvC
VRAPEAPVALATGRCRVLGLDPGSLRTGWGVVDCDGPSQRFVAAGVIRTPAGDLAPRLRHINAALLELVDLHAPDEVAIERVFMHRNPDSALKLGQARGVAMCAATQRGAPVFEYTPQAVKLALVGTGAADKLQVAHMVRAVLSIDEALGLDASDALAVGLCHAQSRRLNILTAAVAKGAGA